MLEQSAEIRRLSEYFHGFYSVRKDSYRVKF